MKTRGKWPLCEQSQQIRGSVNLLLYTEGLLFDKAGHIYV